MRKFELSSSNLPPKMTEGKQNVGTAYWIKLYGDWYRWCGTNKEMHYFEEMLNSGFFADIDLIEDNWRLDLFKG